MKIALITQLFRGTIEIDQVGMLLYTSKTINYKQLTINVPHIRRMILNLSVFNYLNLR